MKRVRKGGQKEIQKDTDNDFTFDDIFKGKDKSLGMEHISHNVKDLSENFSKQLKGLKQIRMAKTLKEKKEKQDKKGGKKNKKTRKTRKNRK